MVSISPPPPPPPINNILSVPSPKPYHTILRSLIANSPTNAHAICLAHPLRPACPPPPPRRMDRHINQARAGGRRPDTRSVDLIGATPSSGDSTRVVQAARAVHRDHMRDTRRPSACGSLCWGASRNTVEDDEWWVLGVDASECTRRGKAVMVRRN